jgi:hypothetical protein
MEKEKVIQKAVEAALMSLAHEILRNRNRMDIAQIQQMAQRVIDLAKGNNQEAITSKKEMETPPKAIEEVLLKPVKEAEFEAPAIDFVSTLFEGSIADYRRVISVLHSKQNIEEAMLFIEQMVKPDYDWSDKKEIVAAFIENVSENYPPHAKTN